MAQGNVVTEVGNLTRDPELRFTNGGMAVTTCGMAVSYKKNRDADEETSFFDVTSFGSLAENVAESLNKGQRIIVSGRLQQRSWETQDGDKRSKIEIVADEIAPSLRWQTAQVAKSDNGRNGGGGGGNRAPQQQQAPAFNTDEEPF